MVLVRSRARKPRALGLFGVGMSGSLLCSTTGLPSLSRCCMSCFAFAARYSSLSRIALSFRSSAPVSAGGGELPSARKRPPVKTSLSPMALNIFAKSLAAFRSTSLISSLRSLTSSRIASLNSSSMSFAICSTSSSTSSASSVLPRPSRACAFRKRAFSSSCFSLSEASAARRAVCHWSIFSAALALLFRQARCITFSSLFSLCRCGSALKFLSISSPWQYRVSAPSQFSFMKASLPSDLICWPKSSTPWISLLSRTCLRSGASPSMPPGMQSASTTILSMRSSSTSSSACQPATP
mmetsp:Transcript_74617/g.218581  ORF Transcript_74617/g.218581 Transcript_74617/m.218581 type:complete len:296 (-) Transcript_74617:436-1323(-)